MSVCPINITLNNGAEMPALGLGTWQATDDELEKALETALETGYRHFDTASVYGNEHVIGKVINKWIESGEISREDLFIVTKLPSCGNRQSSVEKFMKKSLNDLQMDYVDLYLIHMPMGTTDNDVDILPQDSEGHSMLDKDTDLGMEEQVDAGRAKSIGISNFNEEQIQRILDSARIKPVCLQVELHVYFQQRPLVDFCRQNDISVVSYASLGSRGAARLVREQFGATMEVPDLLNNDTVLSIAAKHDKEAAHILLRHVLQRGIATIPKSSNPDRIISNFQVFDFELDENDMEQLNNLDQGKKGRAFDFAVFGPSGIPVLSSELCQYCEKRSYLSK